jgi:hypothetical protein
MSNFIGKAIMNVVRAVAARRRPNFTCGDCERWQRCALPPSDNCVIRVEQMSRAEEHQSTRRANALAPW